MHYEFQLPECDIVISRNGEIPKYFVTCAYESGPLFGLNLSQRTFSRGTHNQTIIRNKSETPQYDMGVFATISRGLTLRWSDPRPVSDELRTKGWVPVF